MSKAEVAAEQLELFTELRELAKAILDECDCGETVETEHDAKATLSEAIELAERFIKVAKGELEP